MFTMIDDFTRTAAAFPDPFRLLIRERAESTNAELRALAMAGAPAGLVLLALHQTAGRGRRGAAWFSPPGQALTFSILLRPQSPPCLWPRLAIAAGLAVAESLESLGVDAAVKWPNDIWIGRRKVAGILVEAGPEFAVVGIGINVNVTHFPPELAELATSLRLATARDHPPHDLLGAIIRGFAPRRAQISGDFAQLLDALRPRCALTGHWVSLTSGNQCLQGRVEGISPDGQLLLRGPAGLQSLIQADQIRILPTPPAIPGPHPGPHIRQVSHFRPVP